MLSIICFAMLQMPAADLSPDEESMAQLAKLRRVYVDILTGGESALQIRDLLMTSLQKSKLFIVTEDEEKADAILKGAASDETFTDSFQSTDNINAHSQIGGGTNGNSRNTNSRYLGLSIGENESRKTEERKHEAIATVRLVARTGDVIWSATAESLGGKFLGASADVADKIAKRLAEDYKLARGKTKPAPSLSSSNK